jgi:hypothetical protein
LISSTIPFSKRISAARVCAMASPAAPFGSGAAGVFAIDGTGSSKTSAILRAVFSTSFTTMPMCVTVRWSNTVGVAATAGCATANTATRVAVETSRDICFSFSCRGEACLARSPRERRIVAGHHIVIERLGHPMIQGCAGAVPATKITKMV